MHTRRLGAFVVGMWLMGSVLAWFVLSQSLLNVERSFTNPPPQVQREIDSMGADDARQIFRFQALQFSRRMQETWEVLQLGLGGALLAISVMTAHRSRVMIIATVLLMVIVALMTFTFTPSMNTLARSYDFLPPGAGLREREMFQSYKVWYRVLEIFKNALLLLVTARLMFDFYDFGRALLPWSKSRKRRRRRSMYYGDPPQPNPASGPPVEQQANPPATP